MMVIIVPPFTKSDNCKWKTIPAPVLSVVTLGSYLMCERVNRIGAMIQKHSGDKECPHQHLEAARSKAGEEDFKQRSEEVDAGAEEKRHQAIKTVKKTQFRKLCEVTDEI